MAETKKFLDFTGLQKYDELLKAKVAADIKVVQDDVNTRKVKDTADSDTITWSKGSDGTYTASVAGNVVVDAEYQNVKTKATQSAAAWTKFLDGSNVAYPDGITPALKDLATTASVTKAIKDGDDATLAAANAYADGLAVNYDKAGDAEAAKTAAISAAKTYTDGVATTTLNSAKSYADSLAVNYDAKGAAAQALKDAKAYTDSKVDDKFDAVGSAAQALKDAKSYADGLAVNYDAVGSADAAKTAAIGEAKKYTDGEIGKVNDKIAAINTSIAGGVHFRGVVDPLPVSPFTGYVNGDIVIVGNKEYILNKPTEGEGEWVELGDTTAESQRITALEDDVEILRGADTVEGSVNNAIKVAKAFTTSEINTLVTSGKVKENADAIAILRGADNVEGSVNNAIKVAKAYADSVGSAAQSHTDTKISELVGASGQVGINTAAITKLNDGKDVVGSVDYKIDQAVASIEASIDTITEADINTLFSK